MSVSGGPWGDLQHREERIPADRKQSEVRYELRTLIPDTEYRVDVFLINCHGVSPCVFVEFRTKPSQATEPDLTVYCSQSQLLAKGEDPRYLVEQKPQCQKGLHEEMKQHQMGLRKQPPRPAPPPQASRPPPRPEEDGTSTITGASEAVELDSSSSSSSDSESSQDGRQRDLFHQSFAQHQQLPHLRNQSFARPPQQLQACPPELYGQEIPDTTQRTMIPRVHEPHEITIDRSGGQVIDTSAERARPVASCATNCALITGLVVGFTMDHTSSGGSQSSNQQPAGFHERQQTALNYAQNNNNRHQQSFIDYSQRR